MRLKGRELPFFSIVGGLPWWGTYVRSYNFTLHSSRGGWYYYKQPGSCALTKVLTLGLKDDETTIIQASCGTLLVMSMTSPKACPFRCKVESSASKVLYKYQRLSRRNTNSIFALFEAVGKRI